MLEYVCLNCWHSFKPRDETVSRRKCSNCKSSRVVELKTLAKALTGAKEWLEKQKKPLPFSSVLVVIRDFPTIHNILKNSPFPRGIETLNQIIEWAKDWDNDRLSAKEYLILKLREVNP